MHIPKQIVAGLGGLLGLLMIADYYVSNTLLNKTASELQAWVMVISGAAMVLAALNLIRVQLLKVSMKRPGWQYSIVLVAGCLAMACTGLFVGKTSAQYKFLFNDVMTPIGATLFACMIFFVASASYRAFRARNYQAAILLVSAVLVLLGGAPAGAAVWKPLPAIRDWFLDIPTVAGNRAIVLTTAVGSVALGVKVLLGIEKGHIGSSD